MWAGGGRAGSREGAARARKQQVHAAVEMCSTRLLEVSTAWGWGVWGIVESVWAMKGHVWFINSCQSWSCGISNPQGEVVRVGLPTIIYGTGPATPSGPAFSSFLRTLVTLWVRLVALALLMILGWDWWPQDFYFHFGSQAEELRSDMVTSAWDFPLQLMESLPCPAQKSFLIITNYFILTKENEMLFHSSTT